jgi:hypothetical protein
VVEVSTLRTDPASCITRAEIDERYGMAIQRTIAEDIPNQEKWLKVAAYDRGRWNEYRAAGLVADAAVEHGGPGLDLDDPRWDRVRA